MRILVISTTVMTIPPPGYSGLEFLVYQWSCEFQKAGHQVTVVAPEGSQPTEGVELIPTQLGEPEESAYLKYKDRLQDYDAVLDSTWRWWSMVSQMEADRQLPILHAYHSDPAVLGSPPPVRYPCFVSLSKTQGEEITRRWGCITRTVYNGIDLGFYKVDPEVKRGNRLLWLGRYCPEKATLEAIHIARKCKVSLDLYGDTRLVANRDYVNRVMAECDQRSVVFHEGVSREDTVRIYQSHRALIHLVNYTEAFGLVPVECMACGTPVIVNRRGGLQETVKNSRTGFVADSLEQAEEVITSGKIDSIKPEDCRKQAEKFSIEKSAKGYLGLLQDVAWGIYW